MALPALSAVSTTSPPRLISHRGRTGPLLIQSIKKEEQRTSHVVLFRRVSGPVDPVGVLISSFTPGLGWNVFMSLVTCIIKLTLGHRTGSIPESKVVVFSPQRLPIRHTLPRWASQTRSSRVCGLKWTFAWHREAVLASLENHPSRIFHNPDAPSASPVTDASDSVTRIRSRSCCFASVLDRTAAFRCASGSA